MVLFFGNYPETCIWCLHILSTLLFKNTVTFYPYSDPAKLKSSLLWSVWANRSELAAKKKRNELWDCQLFCCCLPILNLHPLLLHHPKFIPPGLMALGVFGPSQQGGTGWCLPTRLLLAEDASHATSTHSLMALAFVRNLPVHFVFSARTILTFAEKGKGKATYEWGRRHADRRTSSLCSWRLVPDAPRGKHSCVNRDRHQHAPRQWAPVPLSCSQPSPGAWSQWPAKFYQQPCSTWEGDCIRSVASWGERLHHQTEPSQLWTWSTFIYVFSCVVGKVY